LLASSLKHDDYAEWRIDGSNAVREQRFALTDLTGPRSLRAYASCDEDEPLAIAHREVEAARHLRERGR